MKLYVLFSRGNLRQLPHSPHPISTTAKIYTVKPLIERHPVFSKIAVSDLLTRIPLRLLSLFQRSIFSCFFFYSMLMLMLKERFRVSFTAKKIAYGDFLKRQGGAKLEVLRYVLNHKEWFILKICVNISGKMLILEKTAAWLSTGVMANAIDRSRFNSYSRHAAASLKNTSMSIFSTWRLANSMVLQSCQSIG